MPTEQGQETTESVPLPMERAIEHTVDRLSPSLEDRASYSEPPSTLPKERMTVTLPVPLLERLRNTVYWKPELTIAGLIEAGLSDVLSRLEQENGGPFGKRMSKLKGGRRKRLSHTTGS